MRASITADPTRGPGYGIIEVRGAGHMPDPVFVIYRSDGKSLSGGGWQESESALRPDAWENDGGNLRLAVGPAVVNEMDNLESYRISLPGSGLCPLSVQNLVYSHMGGGQGVGSFVPLPDPSPVQPQVAPEPGPEREPEPSPDPGPVEIPPRRLLNRCNFLRTARSKSMAKQSCLPSCCFYCCWRPRRSGGFTCGRPKPPPAPHSTANG